MAKSVSIPNPKMLKWARESAGMSLAFVASKLKKDSSSVESWEKGEATPTFRQLELLAERYKRPTMVFFLSDPPQGFSVVRDYRTVLNSSEMSHQCRFAIRNIQEKQAWASAFLSENNEEEITFIGQSSLDDDEILVSSTIRKLIGISVEEQVRFSSQRECFNGWREKCESLGILVFSFSRVDVNEMRGFAITDKFAPVIAVNAKDSFAARTFSLIHELVHLLIGDSGLSTRSRNAVAAHEVERFCESVTAEAFIPMDDLLRRLPMNIGDAMTIVEAISRVYKCSLSAATFRLVDAEKLDMKRALRMVEKFEPLPAKSTSVPIPQDILAISRNGKYFSRLVTGAYQSGQIHGVQLSRLLNSKLRHLSAIEKRLNPFQIHAKSALR